MDEVKGWGMVSTTHGISSPKTISYGTVLETFDLLWKGRNCVFAMNNHYWRNTGVWLQTQIEISRRPLEGKKFKEAVKILTLTFEGETNDDNSLQL